MLVLVVVLAGAAVVRAEQIPQTYLGTYRFVGGSAQREALTREIDRVADQLGFFIRGIARRRMHSEIRPEGTVAILENEGDFHFRFEQRPSVPCDGDWHPAVGANDEDSRGRCSYRGGQLRYEERAEDGTVSHAISLSEDGLTLRMAIRISHPRLPDDVQYRLTYRRR